jgi:hypothetical protein
MDQGRRWTRQFTQVRATLRCNTLLLLCGGLASRGAEDEQPREGLGVRMSQPPLWWWLTYIYSVLGPLPLKLRREGIAQRPILKGDK